MKPCLILLNLLLPFCLSAKMPGNVSGSNSSLAFIENKGQVTDQYYKPRKDIDVKLNAQGMDIFIGEGQIHYQWSKIESSEQSTDNSEKSLLRGFRGQNEMQVSSRIATYRLDVSLVGANKNAEVITEDQQEYYENYYLPQYPDGLTAHSYKKIIYKNIYPNIDWVLYIANSKIKIQNSKEIEALKYDFIVHEGGNPKDIQIKYEGATSVSLSNNTSPLGVGGIVTSTPFGSITEQAPYSYIKETKQKVSSSFILNDNILSFDIAPYNGELIIDPQLEWATYYGGSGEERSYTWSLGGGTLSGFSGPDIATDKLDNVYIAGMTTSANNIATTGAYQDTIIGSTGSYLAKFKSDGMRQWATYYGGPGLVWAHTIACDKNNDVYFAGRTTVGSGIATTGSFKDTLLGHSDGFLVKFNTAGSRMWATYYGGGDEENIEAIAIDNNNDVFITGYTSSTNNMTTPGAHQPGFPTASNNIAYLAKFNASGSRLWGTYYGDGYSSNFSLACDAQGNVYLGGATSSINGIATAGSFQDTLGGVVDGYIAKFNSTGIRLWGTYYGGYNYDAIWDIICDSKSNIYVTGYSASDNTISSVGSYQPQHGVLPDGFIAKFDSNGTRQWGTYYGGDKQDNLMGIAIDKRGDICLTGMSYSSTNMTTPGAWKKTNTTGASSIFAKFTPDGQRLWSTYYGDGNSFGTCIAIDTADNYYICGETSALTGIATVNGSQTQYGGSSFDNFLLKALPDSLIYIECDTAICIAPGSMTDTFIINYATVRSFYPGNIFTAQLSDSNGNFATPLVVGTITTTGSGMIKGAIPSSVKFSKGYKIRIVASSPFYISGNTSLEIAPISQIPVATGDTILCTGGKLQLFANSVTPGATYTWAGPNNFNSLLQNIIIDNVQLSNAGQYIVYADPIACKIADTLNVYVGLSPIKPDITVNSPLCESDTIRFSFRTGTDSTLYSLPWPNLHPIQFTDSGVIDIANRTMTGTYIVTAVRGGCASADTADILVKIKPTLTAGSNSPLKSGEELRLLATVDSANSFYWNGPDSFSSNEQNPVIPFASKYKAGIYAVKVMYDGCSSTDTITVNIDGESYLILFPNPNNGSFTIKGVLKKDQYVPMNVIDAVGQKIWSGETQTIKSVLDYTIDLPAAANGVYQLRLRADGNNIAIPFVVKK
jgi:hypothetical protein